MKKIFFLIWAAIAILGTFSFNPVAFAETPVSTTTSLKDKRTKVWDLIWEKTYPRVQELIDGVGKSARIKSYQLNYFVCEAILKFMEERVGLHNLKKEEVVRLTGRYYAHLIVQIKRVITSSKPLSQSEISTLFMGALRDAS